MKNFSNVNIDIYKSELYNKSTNKDELFLANENLAYKIYHKYKDSIDLENDDFMQECFFFLWKAIKCYNPEKGCLSTLVFKIAQNFVFGQSRKIDALSKRTAESYDNLSNISYEVNFLDEIYTDEIIKKISMDYRQALDYNKLRTEGYNVEQIKVKLNCEDDDIQKFRRQIRSLRKKRSDFII